MKGTNRKEMRKLLNKAIALMKMAFDNGIDMSVGTRLKDNGRPWFTGYVYEEGTDFSNPVEDGKSNLFFTCYEWRDVAGNEDQLERVKEFIENHKK